MTIPNLLTMLRIALIPIFVAVFLLPVSWSGYAAGSVFAIACITDWFDGYLARKLDQITEFGAFIDPVADKLIVSVALILLTFDHAGFGILIASLVIISREIIVSALREWMAHKGAREVVTVSHLGQIKTASQMAAIILLLISPTDSPYFLIGLTALYVATTLTALSMLDYLNKASRTIQAKDI